MAMAMTLLEIVRESTALLCKDLPIFMFITLTLIFPVSCITLSQVFSESPLAGSLSLHLHKIAEAGGLLQSPINQALFTYSSQALLSHAFSFPVFITVWLLAKTATLYIAHCSDIDRQPSLLGFLSKGPRLWSRLAVTYLYTCVLVLGFTSFAMASPLILVGVTQSVGGSRSVLALIAALLAMVLSIGFAHLLMTSEVAHVVSVVEKKCAGRALLRALNLLQGRAQLALILLVVSELAAFMADGAFQKRVMAAQTATSLLEAPFLIFFHSFIRLFQIIVNFVFYRSCFEEPSAEYEIPPSPDAPFPLQQISVAVEIMDQCSKIYTV
ncbi:hypothetical protein KP509_02G009000 [Ceratopteris richardii]|uniref:Transmembrane protein n=1 Tax=Ceratopteris richardii TaxID=49495 RepID=A0A8T2V6E3_CERRI|nr:hypothetical protein KP509_02G009000 [Ceratopteris richardii]